MISRESLLAAGFEQSDEFFKKGKLSVYWCKDDDEYFVDHQYPFDYAVTRMDELHALDAAINRPGMRHIEELMNAYGHE